MMKPTSTITSETTFKNWINYLLKKEGFLTQNHEDEYLPAIPDTSFSCWRCNGWIEYKWEKGKYQPGQKRWLDKRAKLGGHCFTIRGWLDRFEITNHRFDDNRTISVARVDWKDALKIHLLTP